VVVVAVGAKKMRNFCHRVFVLCDGGSGSAAATMGFRRRQRLCGGDNGFLSVGF
jgi:hypothetical protein